MPWDRYQQPFLQIVASSSIIVTQPLLASTLHSSLNRSSKEFLLPTINAAIFTCVYRLLLLLLLLLLFLLFLDVINFLLLDTLWGRGLGFVFTGTFLRDDCAVGGGGGVVGDFYSLVACGIDGSGLRGFGLRGALILGLLGNGGGSGVAVVFVGGIVVGVVVVFVGGGGTFGGTLFLGAAGGGRRAGRVRDGEVIDGGVGELVLEQGGYHGHGGVFVLVTRHGGEFVVVELIGRRYEVSIGVRYVRLNGLFEGNDKVDGGRKGCSLP